ncbi:hypothetical protein SUDANB6_00088 [Streptomyces sp. enrichment culture]
MQWRYAVLALGFLGLAGMRAAQGAPAWAVVFVAAAAANAWLAVGREARVAPAGAGREDGTEVDRTEVDRSLHGWHASARQWQLLGAAGIVIGGTLLLLEPALAVFAGAAALFALHRARRAGRAVATLRRVRAVRR